MPAGSKPFHIGERLRAVRKSCGLTQAEVARGIQISRTTLVAIEKGDRTPRIAELQRMAWIYNTSANALLSRDSVFPDIVSKFRSLHLGCEGAVAEAAQRLSDLVRAEVELEDTLGIAHHSNNPSERPLLPGVVEDQAEHDAGELRQWLGLASAPIRDMVGLLELDLGVRLFEHTVDSGVVSLYSFDERLGASMLLNATHSSQRRAYSAARQLGWFISNRSHPSADLSAGNGKSRGERYADRFAQAFLTPARAVKQRFQDIVADSGRLSKRQVIFLARSFAVSGEEILHRLEVLQLIKRGAWEWVESNGGAKDSQAPQCLADLSALRLRSLASQAWRRKLLSEGQLADLLHLDRYELRKILDEESDGWSGVELQSR